MCAWVETGIEPTVVVLEAIYKETFHHLLYLKTVKRFQIKSTGCRDVQHTGLQSIQTRRKS